jgi:hypothetical protein
MRVALYDPEPVCGGPMLWTRMVQTGFRELGHECDVVSFTKSGRQRKAWGQMQPGTAWYDRQLDVVGKYKDCKDVLAPYDGVVLTEPLIGIQDKQALKSNWAIPYYGRVLELAGKPFTTALHAFSYSQKAAPFASVILQMPNFAGTGISHVTASMVTRDNQVMKGIPWEYIPHPYKLCITDDTWVPARGAAGCAGRFVHIDAFHIPALAAAYGTLPDDTIVQLRGACAISNRASLSMEVYEELQKMGYNTGARAGDDVFRPHNWWLTKNGSTVRYDGAYSGWPDSVGVCAAFQVMVSVMADENSHGASSYTQLEGIDAGCTHVATPLHFRPEFEGVMAPSVPTMPSLQTVARDPAAAQWVHAVGRQITEALSWDDAKRKQIAQYNREVVRVQHDPRLTAKALVEILS